MEIIFIEITILICLATVLALFCRLLKQPPILAYILTGILIGPFGQLQFPSINSLSVFSELGITLLLFLLGLEFKLKGIKSVGYAAFIIGLAQIVFTSTLGFFLAIALKFSELSAFYIGITLAFSSTIIIIKLLSDKKDLGSLSGKISSGILIFHNIAAIFILMFLSIPKETGSLFLHDALSVLIKGAVLILLIVFLNRKILPKFIHSISGSEEILFLFILGWVFGMCALVSSSPIGFPIEIGGFLAGIALADSIDNFQIVLRVKTLRDFFIIIFFVSLGMNMQFQGLSKLLMPIILFSIFIIFVKPLITMIIMGVMGYRKRISFLVGLNMSQISEFSFIILFLGSKAGHLPDSVSSLMTFLGITTFILSTYTISGGNTLYKLLTPYVGIFERKENKEKNNNLSDVDISSLNNHIILVGSHRIGKSFLKTLGAGKHKVVVIDFDPDIISDLNKEKILNVFGDIADPDIVQKAGIEKADLIISTVPDIEDNLLLLQDLKNESKKVIVVAQDVDEAKILYKAGAYYVVLPYLVGGVHLARIIKNDHLKDVEDFKTEDLALLS
jgi:Kef-type K+ transport system membrane component KefB